MVSGVVSLLSFVFYYISIFKGKTVPNQATWLILSIVGLIIFSSYYSLGERSALWLPLSFVVGPILIFILSIKYGVQKWSVFDKWCLFGAVTSLVFWFISGNAFLALSINILIDLLGMLPTIRKSYLNPETEEGFPWLLTCIASIVNIFAVSTWNFDTAIYPLYMLIINTMVVVIIYLRSIKKVLKLFI